MRLWKRWLMIGLSVLLLLGLTHTSIAQDDINTVTITSNQDWQPLSELQDDGGIDVVAVPPGCFDMGANDFEDDVRPLTRICFETAFVIDRTEVTNDQFGSSGLFDNPDQPRSSINWFDASAYCASRTFQGEPMRLPTEAEWEYAARGPSNNIYPFGNSARLAVAANVENSFNTTSPVGSFGNGASWVGALDMAGNVWEWTSSIYRPYPYDAADGRESTSDTESPRVLRGGSANNPISSLTAINRYFRTPETAHSLVGFRCAADAVSLPIAPPAPVVSTPEPINGVQMVRISSQCFIMGSDDDLAGEGDGEEDPHEICVDQDYFIDVFEVSNQQVREFAFQNPSKFAEPDQPRDSVTWFEAQEYCASRGGRLPTEAEWELAARGPRSYLYTWQANEFEFSDAQNLVWSINSSGQSLAVNSKADTDVSWSGVVHMAGNVSEWTSTFAAPYPYNATDGRDPILTGDDTSNVETPRVVRGINYLSATFPRSSYRDYLLPEEFRDTVGFRCVIPEVSDDAIVCGEPTDNVAARLTINEIRAIDTVEDEPTPDELALRYFLNTADTNPPAGAEARTARTNDVFRDFPSIALEATCDEIVRIVIILDEVDGQVRNLIGLDGDPIRENLDLSTTDPSEYPISFTRRLTGEIDGRPYDYSIRYTLDVQARN